MSNSVTFWKRIVLVLKHMSLYNITPSAHVSNLLFREGMGVACSLFKPQCMPCWAFFHRLCTTYDNAMVCYLGQRDPSHLCRGLVVSRMM